MVEGEAQFLPEDHKDANKYISEKNPTDFQKIWAGVMVV